MFGNNYNNIDKNNRLLKSSPQIRTKHELDALLRRTIYQIRNSNKVFFNYLVFKTFASSTNYIICQEYLLEVFKNVINQHNTFEFHINLQTFSISSCQRYYTNIKYLMQESDLFSKNISVVSIYYTPSVITHIQHALGPLFNTLESTIIYHSKQNSEELLKLLLQDIVK